LGAGDSFGSSASSVVMELNSWRQATNGHDRPGWRSLTAKITGVGEPAGMLRGVQSKFEIDTFPR
jgi:hypothetical protein